MTDLHTTVSIPLNKIQIEEVERAANEKNMTIVEFIRNAALREARRNNRPSNFHGSQSAQWYHASNNPYGEQHNDMRSV